VLVVEDTIGGGAVDTCSVVEVLAGCEQPANRAVPASNETLSARAIEDFTAVIVFSPNSCS